MASVPLNTDSSSGLPAAALPVPDAARQLVAVELWEHYRRTIKDRASLPRRNVRYSTWTHGDEAVARNRTADRARAAQAAKDQAWAAIKNAFHEKLLEGSLVAYVRRDFPFGSWRPVPADAWQALRIRDWRKGVAEGAGARLVDLRIAPNHSTGEEPPQEEPQPPSPGQGEQCESGAAELPQPPPAAPVTAASSPAAVLQPTIDERTSRIIIKGVGQLIGSNYRLVAVLAETATEDVAKLRPPEEHRFVKVQQLTKKLNISENGFYRRVSKCRREFGDMVAAAFGGPVSKELLIENSPWHGFRLNPSIRFVAPNSD